MACLITAGVPAGHDMTALLGHGVVRGETAEKSQADSLPEMRRQHETQRVQAALHAAGGDRDLAARTLGISRTTLWRKLR